MATTILARPSTVREHWGRLSDPPSTDDFTALVMEIQEVEGVGGLEASGIALSILDDLAAFAVVWDDWTICQGNNNAVRW